jgi:hypothetical protein
LLTHRSQHTKAFCDVAASQRIFLSLANASVQHIYFLADANKKIKELHSPTLHKPQKSQRTGGS